MRKIYVLAVIIIFLAGMSCKSSKTTKIMETKEVIKTYPYGDPDPVPIMTRSSLWGRGNRIYPYSFIDKFSRETEDREWTVVSLENPYIKVQLLPEVGGKIWGALEKATAQEFIYTNHVLKFREIALRGPWVSGGIEFNFGIVGHTPAGAHPVDYLLRQNPDGSATCFVGTRDWPSRTRWAVAVTVPKDKAFFETKALWINPSPFHQAYYCWMNGAVRTGEDLQYIFPGRFHIAHNFSVPLKPWPYDASGRNLAWYKNNDFGSYKSYFTVGEYEDFFGGYWHDSQFGFGHWARHDDIPGQKIWIWGLSRQGMIWEDLLTDSDGQYCEPQAGRYLNQNDHSLFPPYASDIWREIWFPYKEIGPMVKASPLGVLNARINGQVLQMGICPLQALEEDLVVTADGHEIYQEQLRLSPLEVYKKDLPLTAIPNEFEVKIGSKLIYSQDPQNNDLKRPIDFHAYEERSLEGLFLAAGRMESERNYFQAMEKYQEILKRDPLHTRALCRVSELFCRRGEFSQSYAMITRAIKNVMYDPEANYIYGTLSRKIGNLLDAKEALGWAARSLQFRSAAYCQMAEIYLLENKLVVAREYAQRALDYNVYNLNALQVMTISYRKSQAVEEAGRVIEKILAFDPLNHLARFERYLLKPNQKNLLAFQAMIRNELPHENYLEMALYYKSLGLRTEAVQMLELSPKYPTVYYWLAYLLHDTQLQQSQDYLNQANTSSPYLVFPFREETIPVFLWALNKNPQEWRIKYYLGLIYWNKGLAKKTKELFQQCGEPEFAPFYIARAYFYRENEPDRALADYQAAVKVEENNWRYWYHLVNFYNEKDMPKQALKAAEQALAKLPDEVPLQIEMIRALLSNRLYKQAEEILEDIRALPSEGATALHGLFEQCQNQLGWESMQKGNFLDAIIHFKKAKTYPENLGSGKPYDPDNRLQDYFLAICFEKTGEKRYAQEFRQAVHSYTLKIWPEPEKYSYYGGMILSYFGEQEKAVKLMALAEPEPAARKIIQMMKK